jgi:hypothetical protein
MSYLWAGPPREFLQGETRLLWGPGDRSRLSYKSSIWGPIKPLVAFQNCFIFCAAECPDNIYFIQSSDKHNQLNSWKYQTNKRRKIQDKTSMANAMEPFRDSQIPSWRFGLMYRLKPPLIVYMFTSLKTITYFLFGKGAKIQKFHIQSNLSIATIEGSSEKRSHKTGGRWIEVVTYAPKISRGKS